MDATAATSATMSASALTAGDLAAGTAANSSTEADGALRRAITYVSGMTDRFAFSTAVRLLGWQLDRLPRGIDAPATSL